MVCPHREKNVIIVRLESRNGVVVCLLCRTIRHGGFVLLPRADYKGTFLGSTQLRALASFALYESVGAQALLSF